MLPWCPTPPARRAGASSLLACALAALLLVTACGGGGGDDDDAATSQPQPASEHPETGAESLDAADARGALQDVIDAAGDADGGKLCDGLTDDAQDILVSALQAQGGTADDCESAVQAALDDNSPLLSVLAGAEIGEIVLADDEHATAAITVLGRTAERAAGEAGRRLAPRRPAGRRGLARPGAVPVAVPARRRRDDERRAGRRVGDHVARQAEDGLDQLGRDDRRRRALGHHAALAHAATLFVYALSARGPAGSSPETIDVRASETAQAPRPEPPW